MKSDGIGNQDGKVFFFFLTRHTKLLNLFAGCRQNSHGIDERSGDLSRALRPDGEAARDHRVGMKYL